METKTSINQLTDAQLSKFYSLVDTYGPETLKLVNSLTNRGKNSYSALLDKQQLLGTLKHEEEAYNDELRKQFPLGEPVLPGDVIRRVVATRKATEMEPIRAKLKTRCEADFFMLFIVEEVFEPSLEDESKKELKHYIPVVTVIADK